VSGAPARGGSLVPVPGSPPGPPPGPARTVGDAIVTVVSRVPTTRQVAVADPAATVHALARQAARRAALVSGGLALPPGPLGVLTLVPDLMAIWKIQAQLVADIAGAHGRAGSLTREQMLYCLFRHAASQVLRDVVVRAGQRAIVHRLTVSAVQSIAARIGVQLSQQMIAKSAGRFVPGLGAAAVAAYAWWDTDRVARTADALFSREIVVDPEPADDAADAPAIDAAQADRADPASAGTAAPRGRLARLLGRR
jgi:hypothetical protein